MLLGLIHIIIIAVIAFAIIVASIVIYRYTRWRNKIVLSTRIVLGPWRASVPLPYTLNCFSKLIYQFSIKPSFMFLQPVLPPPTMSSTTVAGNLLVDDNTGKDITDIFDVKSNLLGRGGSAKVLVAYPRNSWVNSNIQQLPTSGSFMLRSLSTNEFDPNPLFNRDKIPIHRRYALKIVCSDHPEVLWKFEREKFILKDLDHPNIIRLYAVYSSVATSCYLLELCTGGHLGQVLNRQQPRGYFTENTAKYYIKQLLDCVAYCHSRGIVHRDIKLQNILLENHSERAYLKLIDFGNAVYFPGQLPLTKLVGTTYTAAPEVFERSYDEKCDIWSIGVVTYICLCGKRPFNTSGRDNDDPQDQVSKQKEIIKAILRGEYSIAALQARNISETALDFITLCLKRNYKNRWSAMDLLNHPFFNTNPIPSITHSNSKAEISTSPSNSESITSHPHILETPPISTRRNLTENEIYLLRERFKQLLPPDIEIPYHNSPSSPKRAFSPVVLFPTEDAVDPLDPTTDTKNIPSSIDEDIELGLRSTLSCPSSPPSPSHFPVVSPTSSPIKQISSYTLQDPFYISITWFQVLVTLIVTHMPGYFLHFERIIFSWSDSDDDGLINKYELSELVQAIWPGAPPTLASLLFDVMDIDCSGSLSYTEFLSNLVSFKEVLSNKFLVFEALSILDSEKKGYICLQDILKIFSLIPDNLSLSKHNSSSVQVSNKNPSFLPSFFNSDSKIHPNLSRNNEFDTSSITAQWRKVEARMTPLFISTQNNSPFHNIVLLDDLVSWINNNFTLNETTSTSISSLPHIYHLGEPTNLNPLGNPVMQATLHKFASMRSDSEVSNQTNTFSLTNKVDKQIIDSIVNDNNKEKEKNKNKNETLSKESAIISKFQPRITPFHYFSLYFNNQSRFLNLAKKINSNYSSNNTNNIPLNSSVNTESELFHDNTSAVFRFASNRSALSGGMAGLSGVSGVSGVTGLSWANNSNRNYSLEGYKKKNSQNKLTYLFSKIHSSKDSLKSKFENMTKHLKPLGDFGDDSYVVINIPNGVSHQNNNNNSMRRTSVMRSPSGVGQQAKESSARIRERERENNLIISIPGNNMGRMSNYNSPVKATPIVNSPTNKSLQIVELT